MARSVRFVAEQRAVRYVYRLRPGVVSAAALIAEWGRCRWIWNECVAAGKQAKATDDRSLFLTDKDLTAARGRIGWLREGSQNAQQQVLRQYRGKKAAGQGGRRIKKKHAAVSINYTRNGFAIKDSRLVLAGGIRLPVVWSRELPSEPSSVRVYQDSLGHWYASFVVRVAEQPLPAVGGAIGIDWGVKMIATTTDPVFDLPTPEYGKRNAAKLARYQRMMARRATPKNTPNSGGYTNAKRLAAKAHKKVARQRQDTARKWAQQVVAVNQLIAVEDFKPTFLAKSTMARKAADNAIGATKTELMSIAQRAGRQVVLVPPAWTTQMCSDCGTRAKDRLTLRDRISACANCGNIADRDRNAARRILALAGQGPPSGPFQDSADAVRQPRQANQLEKVAS